MKRYFLKAIQDALFTWVVLGVSITAASVLYATLNITGTSKDTSLLISFTILIGLILLSLIPVIKTFLMNLAPATQMKRTRKPKHKSMVKESFEVPLQGHTTNTKLISQATPQLLLLIASLLSAGVAVYLTTVHYETAPLICSTNGLVDCARVLSSTYSNVPGTTVPITVPGLAWCIVTAALAIAGLRLVSIPHWLKVTQFLWTLVGMLTVLYLIYIEIVRLHTICTWCTVLQVLILIMFLITQVQLQSWSAEKRKPVDKPIHNADKPTDNKVVQLNRGNQTMRIRYRYVTYRYTDGSQQQLERHYRELLHDALRQSHQSILQGSATWRPLADIRESVEMMTVKIELAGMKEEEIDVTLYEDALVISGERHNTPERTENLYYHEAQIRYGPFRVEVLILSPIDREGIKARYENGFLWVDLPKIPESRMERVHIQRSTNEFVRAEGPDETLKQKVEGVIRDEPSAP